MPMFFSCYPIGICAGRLKFEFLHKIHAVADSCRGLIVDCLGIDCATSDRKRNVLHDLLDSESQSEFL